MRSILGAWNYDAVTIIVIVTVSSMFQGSNISDVMESEEKEELLY